MVDIELINQIKRITIISLVQDDDLMETLVLKGGNALSLGYGLSERASYDLDFSMEDDFEEEIAAIQERLARTVTIGFASYGYVVIDFKITEKPKMLREELQPFWGGYYLEFKLVEQKVHDQHYPNQEAIRRNALALNPNQSSKFSVDISKFEFVGKHRVLKEIDGVNYYVYAPQLIVFEKIRALAQKLPEYQTDILLSKKPYQDEERARPRDFFDIHAILENYDIDITSIEAKDVLAQVFQAKRVPLEYLKKIRSMKEVHKAAYDSVKDTLSQSEDDKGFDFYFDYVIERIEHLLD
ncbi:nucleotidyl transferase AbiEii/AbiGii toxin family protein [Mucilaginibacter daejeonensis]|uniref:nucleotidyl transferase AbiEii/AbiGii toxin family protein n=1 Tax=Mucilaginibacter daejeonensis TaxID=398049 RepID=UPI001D178064|nr:nucleotidyl transferase AbiEii/AbiGii toxin family protein [Mucilaginibacter daejeonensis]UEG54036.1 nucleotidyl transferase AbiEii/AbiGii toxin family protein [Mucilaginibacter daejeonensis]